MGVFSQRNGYSNNIIKLESVSETLKRKIYAAFYKEEADEAITRLVGLIEPVMIIFMGTCIGLVIAGILPAIYNSMRNIS